MHLCKFAFTIKDKKKKTTMTKIGFVHKSYANDMIPIRLDKLLSEK